MHVQTPRYNPQYGSHQSGGDLSGDSPLLSQATSPLSISKILGAHIDELMLAWQRIPRMKQTPQAAELVSERIIDAVGELSLPERIIDYRGISDRHRSFASLELDGTRVTTVSEALRPLAQVIERQTLREHHIRVLTQWLRYLSGAQLPQWFSPRAFVLLLSLHDAGKALSDKEHQHANTVALVRDIEPFLPLTRLERSVFDLLVGEFEVGQLVFSSYDSRPSYQDKVELINLKLSNDEKLNRIPEFASRSTYVSVESGEKSHRARAELVCAVSKEACRLEVPAYELGRLALLYYQADTLAYTADSQYRGRRGELSLDGLFAIKTPPSECVFDYSSVRQRVAFAPMLEKHAVAFEEALACS